MMTTASLPGCPLPVLAGTAHPTCRSLHSRRSVPGPSDGIADRVTSFAALGTATPVMFRCHHPLTQTGVVLTPLAGHGEELPLRCATRVVSDVPVSAEPAGAIRLAATNNFYPPGACDTPSILRRFRRTSRSVLYRTEDDSAHSLRPKGRPRRSGLHVSRETPSSGETTKPSYAIRRAATRSFSPPAACDTPSVVRDWTRDRG